MPPPRILVVDDTEEVRTLVARVLAGEGYDVLEAESGVNALRACGDLNGEVQLLLTDVNMPGMGGVELAAQLRTRYPEVYVLYFSGQSETDQMEAQMTDPRRGFLMKPFLPTTLIQLVEGALASAKRPGQEDSPRVLSGIQGKQTA